MNIRLIILIAISVISQRAYSQIYTKEELSITSEDLISKIEKLKSKKKKSSKALMELKRLLDLEVYKYNLKIVESEYSSYSKIPPFKYRANKNFRCKYVKIYTDEITGKQSQTWSSGDEIKGDTTIEIIEPVLCGELSEFYRFNLKDIDDSDKYFRSKEAIDGKYKTYRQHEMLRDYFNRFSYPNNVCKEDGIFLINNEKRYTRDMSLLTLYRKWEKKYSTLYFKEIYKKYKK